MVRLPKITKDAWLYLLAAISIGIIFPPRGNQYVYLVPAYKRVLPSLETDWYSNIQDTNLAFTKLTIVLLKIAANNLTVFSYLLMFVALMANIVSCYTIIRIIHILIPSIRIGKYKTVFLLTVCLSNVAPDIKSGVAGLYFLQPLLQPSSFGVFFLLGIYKTLMMLRKRETITSSKLFRIQFYFIVATAFHPSLIVSYLIYVISLAITLILNKKITHKETTLLGGASFSILIFQFVLNPQLIKLIHPDNSLRLALEYFASNRIPYHVIPAEWITTPEIIRLLICLLGVIAYYISDKRSMSSVFLLMITLGMLASIIVGLSPSSTSIQLAMPWRVSIFLYPIAFLYLVIQTINVSIIRRSETKILVAMFFGLLSLIALGMKIFAVSIILVLFSEIIRKGAIQKIINMAILVCIVALAFTSFDRTSNAYKADKPILSEDFLPDLRDKGTGIVPLESDDLRLKYGLPIYVNNQAAPNASSEIITWVNRVEQVNKAYANLESLCGSKLLKENKWIILTNGTPVPECLKYKDIYLGESWKAVVF